MCIRDSDRGVDAEERVHELDRKVGAERETCAGVQNRAPGVRGAYAWRTVLNSGARLPLGSDFPVEFVNPFFGIYSAVIRQDQTGNPPGGWFPDQRLSLAEAVRG